MKGIIMMGGYGTRMEPLTLRTPKSLLPVGGKANVDYLIEELKNAGINNVVISANSNNKKVKHYIKDQNIKFIIEKTSSDDDKLGVVGAIQYLKSAIGEDDYLILAGDNFFHGFDMKEFCSYHKSENPLATLGLFQLEDKTDVEKYGIAVLNKNNRIISFQEKPKPEQAKSKLASTFIQAISVDFLKNHIDDYVEQEKKQGRKPDQIGDMWSHYAKKLPVMGKSFQGFWGDIGALRNYLRVNRVAMENLEGVTKRKGVKIHGQGVKIHDNVGFGKNVKIRGPVVIEKGAEISENSIIGPHVHIMKGSKIRKGSIIENSIIFENTEIGYFCRINGSVVDGGSKIENDCSIEPGSIIGYGTEIGENTKVFSDTRVWPFMKISKNSVIRGTMKWPIMDSEKRDLLVNSCYWK